MATTTLASLILASALLVGPAAAQNENGITVWGSVVVTTFADRVPLLSPDNSVLTPLGANQLYNVGSYFRSRYIGSNASLPIPNLSTDVLDLTQVYAYSTLDPWVQQSAQAFIDGLYPPLQSLNAANSSGTTLANGSTIVGPLGGAQYANIYTASTLDPISVWLSGLTNCPTYTEATQTSYTQTPAFASLKQSTSAFYNSLAPIFASAIPNSAIDYGNAYEVWDFFTYQQLHNSSISSEPNYYEALNMARYLADKYAYATTANTSAYMLTIAGRSLATQILSALYENIDAEGTGSQLITMFTSWEPLMSFAALLGLPASYPSFQGMPNRGSSLAVELYSQNTPDSTPTYPTQEQDLYVRVLWRNGSDVSDELVLYTIDAIDGGGSSGGFPLADFVVALQGFALGGPGEWCSLCGGNAIFCPYYVESAAGPGSSFTVGSGGQVTRQLSSTVAGVVGAMATLAVLALALMLSLCCGVRVRRDRANLLSKARGRGRASRRSANALGLGGGGFKGSEKLASDVDLPKSGAPIGTSVAPVHHNRTDSWEMKEGAVGERREERDSQMTAVQPEVTEGTGIKLVDEDAEDGLGNMKAVETRESV